MTIPSAERPGILTRVSDVIAAVEARYPPELAENWDRIGLVCGEPDAPVRRVLLAVDVDHAVVEQAAHVEATLIVAHHPLLLRGIHTVAATTPKGRLLHDLIRSGTALYVAHTNADVANPGVSDALAARVGLPAEGLKPLRATGLLFDSFSTSVPAAEAERVLDAISAAGAGETDGRYRRSAWLTEVTGTFVPGDTAEPTIGVRGQVQRVPELRLDTIMPRRRRDAVIQALRDAHPYEEPAFHVIEAVPRTGGVGIGRIGELSTPVTLRQFAASVAEALPHAPAGIRAGGDPDRMIRRVAVSGGAGQDLLADAAAAKVDVFVTADLRHHVAADFLAHPGNPALIDAGHWATERPWLDQAAEFLRQDLAASTNDIDIVVSDLITDPWTVRA